jgi:hypothetical protein
MSRYHNGGRKMDGPGLLRNGRRDTMKLPSYKKLVKVTSRDSEIKAVHVIP